MAEKKKDRQRVITPLARVSFPNVFKARAFEKDKEPKFSCTLLFPKNTDLTPLKKAVTAAIVEKYGPDKEKWPKLRRPFNDGDEKADLEGYAGMIYVTASNKFKPEVVDQKMRPISEESGKFYAGCYALFSLRAFCYGGKGTPYKPGVSFSLDAVQKHSDGEPFSGRLGASEVFSEIDSGEDDESNYDDDSDDSSDDDEDTDW